MQTKVNPKVLLGGTEDQYDKYNGLRHSKQSYKQDHEMDSAGDFRESSMGCRRKRGAMVTNS